MGLWEKGEFRENQAKLSSVENNFSRTLQPLLFIFQQIRAHKNYGPYMKVLSKLKYDNLKALQEFRETNVNIAGFLVEPISRGSRSVCAGGRFICPKQELC